MKKQKMKSMIKDLGHENESLKFQLDKEKVVNDSLRIEIVNFEIENNRLSSKNTVLVQSIENLIKEAKTVIELNEKHHFEVKEEPKEWIPKVGDVCEVVGNNEGENFTCHNIPIGEDVLIHDFFGSDGFNVIHKSKHYEIFKKDLKFISRPKPETRTPIV